MRWVINSALYSTIGALVGTLFASMAGYGLAKYVFPGREAVFNVILAGVLVPATALALPLFLLFSKFDQTDTLLGGAAAEHRLARSASTCPESTRRRQCRTSCWSPRASTAPASSVRSSRSRAG